MAAATARLIADGFLAFCGEHGDTISNLKLQKVLYYAQGWYLAFTDEALFDDQIQAWIRGPVVPSVYHAFKGFGWQPITTEPQHVDALSKPIREHIREVWAAYGSFSAYDLETMTHRETPWIKARSGLPADAPSQVSISTEDMRAFFKEAMTRGQQDNAA